VEALPHALKIVSRQSVHCWTLAVRDPFLEFQLSDFYRAVVGL
jgi:hypothetical protein